jgi:hypothetical protein
MAKPAGATKNKNETLIKLNNFLASYFNLLTAFIVIIILSVGFVVFILPKYRQVDAKVKLANEQLEKEYIKLTGYLKKLQTINNDYSNINQDSIDKIRKFLPNQPETESLIEKMEFVAKNNGVILNSLDIDSGQGEPDPKTGIIKPSAQSLDLPPGVGKAIITVNMSGVSYGVMKSLLSVLEKNLRLMDITNLTFAPGDQRVEMIIETYYLR